ncbi:GGDEF domain-containing response regulator [Geomesophilobacter sediminis]|uniref:diguanylate cyclase n=1 Tax=Geomesophilobacter sediminis TaxID=2798584 RepID=A0A8J7JE51_9BACT|nr:diguanylate cyclase [Geomesophilobacter sediminis]MBJ6724179.1 diguanylate cyclase [Geomesophilobacter sediminis]
MKILIAEDDPAFRKLLEKMLAHWGYDVVAARNGAEAYQILLSKDRPSLAILDWEMPELEGIEVCRNVRREIHDPYIYLILLTSHRREEDLVAGMEAGADDYLTKPYKQNELRVRLRAGRRIVELHEDLAAARDILYAKATHDSLTGLWNHEEITEILARELTRAEREGYCVSVIMADLDFFKKVNDTYGHLAGDAVLRITSNKLRAMMRPYDALGRYGGEEFLAVLPNCGKGCVGAYAQRFCLQIGSHPIDTSEGIIPVTMSLGVATTGRNLRWDCTTLIRAADVALYRAKENGRNRVEVSSDCVAA